MFEEYLPIFFLVLFGVITFIELVYYYVVFARFSFMKKKKATAIQQVPVSVVMVVKDAASVLLKTLPRLLNQQYDDFEIVMVNDNSQDETKLLILEYQQQYKNIKLVDLETAVTTIRGKKFALSMGIRCASHEHIIITDPECSPTSTHWIEKMAQNFVGQKKIVLGYSTYEKRNTPFNRLLHFDTLFNAMEYFSLARIHSTYRGDNKNLAFASSLFDAQRGFAAHNHISYGDEDIFISRAANKSNTAIEFSPDAVTVLQRGTNHRYWRDHKEGLYFTRKYNTFKNRLLLNGFGVVNILFYVTLALAVIFTYSDIVLLSVTLGIIALRLISQYFVFGFAAKKLQEKQVIPALLFYDLIFAFLNPIYYLAAQLHRERFSSSTR